MGEKRRRRLTGRLHGRRSAVPAPCGHGRLREPGDARSGRAGPRGGDGARAGGNGGVFGTNGGNGDMSGGSKGRSIVISGSGSVNYVVSGTIYGPTFNGGVF